LSEFSRRIIASEANEWQIEGRDMSGRYIEVDVDVNTGEVLNVDR